jgi:hypothetical protein
MFMALIIRAYALGQPKPPDPPAREAKGEAEKLSGSFRGYLSDREGARVEHCGGGGSRKGARSS